MGFDLVVERVDVRVGRVRGQASDVVALQRLDKFVKLARHEAVYDSHEHSVFQEKRETRNFSS